ncbi:MAG: P27 family phage terminase small subunit [Planctomycetota bacterium]
MKLWKALVPQLVSTGLAKSVDSAELFALCQWWGEYRRWDLDKKSDPYKRLVGMATAYKQFRTIAAKFGLTPSDRASLNVTPNDDSKPSGRFGKLIEAALTASN